jgi:predicted Rossmann-fold nucleotide-binding protein
MQAVIFGWKRDHYKKDLKDCEKIAEELTKNNFNIYTGGGGGFMLAGNRGCYNVDPSKSFAVSVKCLYGDEGETNTYYDENNLIITDTFAERKHLLFKDMDLYIFFPGGMGTIEEFSELITLLKTGELPIKPIVLFNLKYWSTLKSWFEFNKLNWPESYITCIINSVDDFNKFYKNEYQSKQIVKINEDTENKDIENYKPIDDKSNIFNDKLIDNLINEIFNDPIFKEDLNNLLDENIDFDNDGNSDDYDSDDSDNEFIEIVIMDESEDSKTYSIESSENYNEINLSNYESDSDSESDSSSKEN